MTVLRLFSFRISSSLFGWVSLIWGQVRSPPIGGSASSKVVPGTISPSTTDLATLSAVSLYYTSVWILIFPMYVFRYLEYLYFSSLSISFRSSSCRYCVYAAGSVVYLRIVFMQN
jgi:hypothetical protein